MDPPPSSAPTDPSPCPGRGVNLFAMNMTIDQYLASLEHVAAKLPQAPADFAAADDVLREEWASQIEWLLDARWEALDMEGGRAAEPRIAAASKVFDAHKDWLASEGVTVAPWDPHRPQ